MKAPKTGRPLPLDLRYVQIAASDPRLLGYHLKLTVYYWEQGMLPSDATALARIAGALPDEMAAVLALGGFSREGEELHVTALRRERQRARTRHHQLREAGRRGAEIRHGRGHQGVLFAAPAMPPELADGVGQATAPALGQAQAPAVGHATASPTTPAITQAIGTPSNLAPGNGLAERQAPESRSAPGSNTHSHKKDRRTAPALTQGESEGGHTTWLTPYVQSWRAAYAGELLATDRSRGETARTLKRLEAQYPPEQVQAAFARYVQATDARYASIRKFAMTVGQWLPPGSKGAPASAFPEAAMPDED